MLCHIIMYKMCFCSISYLQAMLGDITSVFISIMILVQSRVYVFRRINRLLSLHPLLEFWGQSLCWNACIFIFPGVLTEVWLWVKWLNLNYSNLFTENQRTWTYIVNFNSWLPLYLYMFHLFFLCMNGKFRPYGQCRGSIHVIALVM